LTSDSTTRKRAGLRSETFHALEAELRSYEKTKAKILEITTDVATRGMGVNLEDAPPTKSIGRLSDPTLQRATALAQNELLAEMKRTIIAIDAVASRQPLGLMKLIRLHYFQRMPALEVRRALGIHRNTFTRWRDQIMEELATELGRW